MHLTWYEDGVKKLQVVYHSESTAFVPEYLYMYRNVVGIIAKVVLPLIKGKIFFKRT